MRILASKLVEQWLKIVKGESTGTTPITVQQQDAVVAAAKTEVQEVKEESTESGDEMLDESEDMVDPLEIPSNHVPEDDVDSKERLSKAKSDGLVYKITVKDGKQVFAKLEASPRKDTDTDKAKTKSELNAKTKSEEASPKGKSDPISKLKIATVDGKKQIKDKVKQESVEPKEQDKVEATKKMEKAKSETVKEKSRSDDKERRSSKENGKESGDTSKEKRKDSSSKSSSSSSSSKHSSSRSSSHKSSRSSSDSKHKTSSSSSSSSRDKSKDSEKDRDRDRSSKSSSSKSKSSSSSSSRSREKRDSTDESVSQSIKDKDTLTKVIPPPINKLGKIPKKTAIVDGEGAATAETGPSKKPSISIEVKKDAENRPKTVKTFNSKFRSHGLAEEAPPPPSRRGLQRPSSLPTVGASIPGTAVTKRPSPPPPEKKDPVVPEKKLKIDTTLAVEKPGIKLIPAKPKSEYLPSNSFNLPFCRLISDIKFGIRKSAGTSLNIVSCCCGWFCWIQPEWMVFVSIERLIYTKNTKFFSADFLREKKKKKIKEKF